MGFGSEDVEVVPCLGYIEPMSVSRDFLWMVCDEDAEEYRRVDDQEERHGQQRNPLPGRHPKWGRQTESD